MLESIFNFIVQLFMWLVGLIGSIVIYPIQLMIVAIFPNVGGYIGTLLDFFNQQLFPVVSFCKELFLDLTCCPRPLFTTFITLVFAKWALAPLVRSIKLIINIWKLKSGGATK